jgi:hypothetical protein
MIITLLVTIADFTITQAHVNRGSEEIDMDPITWAQM